MSHYDIRAEVLANELDTVGEISTLSCDFYICCIIMSMKKYICYTGECLLLSFSWFISSVADWSDLVSWLTEIIDYESQCGVCHHFQSDSTSSLHHNWPYPRSSKMRKLPIIHANVDLPVSGFAHMFFMQNAYKIQVRASFRALNSNYAAQCRV